MFQGQQVQPSLFHKPPPWWRRHFTLRSLLSSSFQPLGGQGTIAVWNPRQPPLNNGSAPLGESMVWLKGLLDLQKKIPKSLLTMAKYPTKQTSSKSSEKLILWQHLQSPKPARDRSVLGGQTLGVIVQTLIFFSSAGQQGPTYLNVVFWRVQILVNLRKPAIYIP